MKRIQLFEFEDQSWFPSILRDSLTRLVQVMHGLVNTKEALSPILQAELKNSDLHRITDFASGNGGPLLEISENLKKDIPNLSLTLTDLYPNQAAMKQLPAHAEYIQESIDATTPGNIPHGLRTMICSFHHLKPEKAKEVLAGFQARNEHCVIYEMTDNSNPKALWWTAVPINIISCLFVSPLSKPFTFGQFIFTYLIPILPIAFAWDGAVSNARTYTVSDLDFLLQDIPSENYSWEKRVIPGRMKKLVLIGRPIK